MRQWPLALLAVILVSGCSATGRADDSATGPSPAASPPSAPTSPSAPESSAPSPSAGEPPAQALGAITVVRSGGFAGLVDRYVVQPDGSMSVETRTDPGSQKKLTADEVKTLRSLAASPALRAEAQSDPVAQRTCADGFIYEVNGGGAAIKGMDCGTLPTEAPTLWKIVELVRQAAERP